ncbi:MAG TPA: succinyl-diaminopimelate desuccinylase [Leucothrix sp.]|nr:succinyl-diaminopimelate desuccinylase [Leucothrix sp.]
MSRTLNLLKELVSRPSITPDDKGCQQLLIDTLEPLGFKAEKLNFSEVENLWLRKGTEAPLFCFAGHTDVVPTGPVENWKFDPFQATEKDGKLYGRGTADMKGGIAAFTIACERFIQDYPDHKGSIAYLITSDEEGPAKNGTVKVIETLEARNEKIDWCIVGEPSSTKKVGDVIKNGRRGSLGCKLKIIGKQGHVAYPHLANNPIHLTAPMLAELTEMQWDQGNEFFPPTTFQVSNLNSGTGVSNVIPGILEMEFNFRFSTEITPKEIQDKVEALIKKHQLNFEIKWALSGMPFLTAKGNLVTAAVAAIKEVAGLETELSTSGGTSDGRFIAPTGAQVLELGPTNASIHQINECIGIDELDTLEKIYYRILVALLL